MTQRNVGKLLASLLAIVCSANLGAQAVITVDTTSNAGTITGNCEFLEAVQAAQSNLAVDGCVAGSVAGPDKIVFANALTGQTISYATAPIFTTGAVILDSRMRAIVLQATGTADALQVSGGTVTVRALDIRASAVGNGVTLTDGAITINNSSLQGRLGINAFGTGSTVTVNNSTVASTETNAVSDIAIRSGVSNNLAINNSTVVATVGKGLDVSSSTGSTTVYSSVIVGATPINGTTTNSGGTLLTTTPAAAGLATTLANNGGPTRTFAVLSLPALNGGTCAASPFPKYDQRFYLNYATGTRAVGAGCDVGAYEQGAQDRLTDLIFTDGLEI
jgi:hypothetical protein